MCLMCVEIARNRMKIFEARVALRELLTTTQDEKALAHYRELEGLSDEKLQEKAQESLDKV